MMQFMYIAIVTIALLVLAIVFYVTRKSKPATQVRENHRESWDEDLERKQIAQQRMEKRRLERIRQEEEQKRKRMKAEIEPMLHNFIIQYVDINVIRLFPIIHDIIMGRSIPIPELLQHNVNRKFADGTAYKVGIVREVNGQVISLTPEMLESLQIYFVNMLEFSSTLKSKGVHIEAIQLHELIAGETKHKPVEPQSIKLSS